MINQELLTYIKNELQRGIGRDEIERALHTANWQDQDIADTFQAAQGSGVPTAPGLPTPPVTSLPGIGELIKTSWGIFTKHAASFITIIIIPQLAFLVLGIVTALLGVSNSTPHAALNPAQSMVLGLIGIISVLSAIVLGPIAYVGLIYAIREKDQRLNLAEAYRRGLHKLGAYWWIAVLSGLIIMTGFLLLIIPGIIFATWFSFGLFIMIDEDIHGMNALLKSKEYVRGLWGKIFVRYLFVAILVVIVAAVVGGIAGGIAGKNNQIAGAIINFVIQLVILPFMMTYYYELFRAVKAMRPNMTFAPDPSQRKLFGIFAAVGPIGLLIIIGLAGYAVFIFFTQPRPLLQYQLPNTLQNNLNLPAGQAPARL